MILLFVHITDSYLVATLPKYDIDIENDWKLLTIFIGANNICPSCKNGSNTMPDFFEEKLNEVIQSVHDRIPRVFVSVMTIFNISQVWDVAHSDKYCSFMEHKFTEWY